MRHEKYEQLIATLLPELPDYIQEFYHVKATVPLSKTTLYNYLAEYKRFLTWLIDTGITTATSIPTVPVDTLANLSLNDAILYKEYLLNRHAQTHPDRELARGSINVKLGALSSLFRYLSEEAEPNNDGQPYFERNVMKKLSHVRDDQTLGQRTQRIKEQLYLTGDDQQLVRYIAQDFGTDQQLNAVQMARYRQNRKRDAAIVALLFGSGMRVSELVDMNVTDLDLRRQTVTVIRKGGYRDVVPILPWCVPYLQVYLQVRAAKYGADKQQPALFLSRYQHKAQRLKVYSIEKLIKKYTTAFGRPSTPHKFRHTLGTNLYAATHDNQLVATQLGQTTTSATELYTHVTDDTLRQTMQQLGQPNKRNAGDN